MRGGPCARGGESGGPVGSVRALGPRGAALLICVICDIIQQKSFEGRTSTQTDINKPKHTFEEEQAHRQT